MRSHAWIGAMFVVFACQPANGELVADVLGPNFETGDDEDAPKGECEARKAIGQGDCEAPLGYQWDGFDCVPVIGCGCNGSDCAELFDTRDACLGTFAICDPCGECLATQVCVLWCGHLGFVGDLLCVDDCEGCDLCGEGSNQLSGSCQEQVTVLPHVECTEPDGG